MKIFNSPHVFRKWKVGFSMAKDIKNKKFRKFEIVEFDLSNVEKIISLVKVFFDEGLIKDYAYAKHDRDEYNREVDNLESMPEGKKFGDLKDVHYHIGFVWYTPVRFITIAKKFEVKETLITNIKSSRFGDYLAYLTHKNRPEKFQYEDEIVTTNIINWQRSRDAVVSAKKLRDLENDFTYFLDLAIKGDITFADVGNKLPAILYTNHMSKFNDAFQVAQQLRARELNLSGDINKTIIYVTGKSGSGKTRYAKGMAAKAGLPYFVSGSSNDFLDGYKGEGCIILDDARGRDFEYADLLKLIDPHSISPYKSRYFNKNVIADLIIITSIQTIEQFIKNLPNSKQEDSFQLKRRLNLLVEVSSDKIKYYKFDLNKDKFVFSGEVKNKVKEVINNSRKVNAEDLIW